MGTVALLGPQRLHPTLSEVVDRLGIEGSLAAVTAGWQEREEEDQEMRDHLGRRVVNLELYTRADDVQNRDPEIFEAHRARQDRLRALQRLYRSRLSPYLAPTRELMSRHEDPHLLVPEREAAIETVRSLDRHHLERIHETHQAFEERWATWTRPAVREHREELAEILSSCSALAVAGGHVAVLLNRLRLFGVTDLLEDQPVIAWSAGAMAMATRVVLFHDSPPQGAGDAEILDEGLGLAKGVVPLPHARRRLRLDDPVRVAIFARRFAPDRAVAMDENAFLLSYGDAWRAGPATQLLTPEGNVIPMVSP